MGSMFDGIVDVFRGAMGLVEAAADIRRPNEIVVKFPPGSAAEGTEAGRYLLTRGPNGELAYNWKPTGRAVDMMSAVSEQVVNHEFGNLASLKEWCDGASLNSPLFVDAKPFGEPVLRVAIDTKLAAAGQVSMKVPRHPIWKRWVGYLGNAASAASIDLTHEVFADLLVDNAEDLAEPTIASMIATFRGARSVTYEASMDSAQSSSVRVEWKGASGGEFRKTDVTVPRMFVVHLSAFGGIWPEGEEPKYAARFRVRVMASKKADDAAPVFRIAWLNALDVEASALADLQAYVRTETGRVTLLGTPSAQTFVPPGLGAE